MATKKNNPEYIEDMTNPAAGANLEAENAALKAELEALKAGAKSDVEVSEQTGPKMVKVRIPRTKNDQEDVFVSVNNYTCIIKRGVEVEVPDYVAEVLRHQEEMLEEIMLFDEMAQKKK